MKLNGYGTYCLYLALKNHFSQRGYDFFRYHGKVSASQDSFMRRRDRFLFEKLARKYEDKELQDYIVAQMLDGNTWVGEMLTPEAEGAYKIRTTIKQSLTYQFANDLDKLLSEVETPKEIFTAKPNEMPYLIEKWMNGDIVLETVVILNDFVNYVPKYDKVLGEDFFIWEEVRMKILKYSPFLEYDKKKLGAILKEKTQ
jgi:hypothetical protein